MIHCNVSGELRVLTYAFIGAPMLGDSPSTKHTPFICKIVSSDLLAGADGRDGGAGEEDVVTVAAVHVDVTAQSTTEQASVRP